MNSSTPTITMIPLTQLVPHPLNANVMSAEMLATLRTHIARSGRYPPCITRRLADGNYEVLDGHQRLTVLAELDHTTAACIVWELSDADALTLLATLNRLHGEDVPGRRALLLQELAALEPLAELARLLPESESELEEALGLFEFDVDQLVADLSAQAEQRAAEAAQLISFLVDPADVPAVDAAIASAAGELTGKNQRGRALVIIARAFLARQEEVPDGVL